MHALLLSAYAAQSHRYWRQRLQEELFADWRWTVMELPARHFSWRVRGNPLHWALQEREALQGTYDLLLATSMVDLATLRGLAPALAAVPSVYYFHENQFAYPAQAHSHSLLEAQMVSLYGALAAERLAFNSGYNRDTFLAGCDALLRRLPDLVPRGIVSMFENKSSVLPVPLQRVTVSPDAAHPWSERQGREQPLRLVWSGRLEHDKGGERLLLVLQRLEAAGLSFELALTGQQFRTTPAAFEDVRREFGHRLVHFGYLDERNAYLALLRSADVVISTALHEFQGLAVMEAVALGCLPAVPDRLAYRELYPSDFLYTGSIADADSEAAAAAALILAFAEHVDRYRAALPDLSAFYSDNMRERYRRTFAAAAG